MLKSIFLSILLLQPQIITGPTRKLFTPIGPPTIRCSTEVGNGVGSASSIAIPICGSAVAGDFSIIFAASAFTLSTTGGWTTIVQDNGHVWNLYAAYKTLSSGDISTGTVTVTASGSFDMPGAMITFVGGTSGIRENQLSGFSSNGTPVTLTTSSAVSSSDAGVYFISNRGSATPTITLGHGVLNTLQTITTTNNPSVSVLADQRMGGGVQSNVFNAAPTGFYQAIQIMVIP